MTADLLAQLILAAYVVVPLGMAVASALRCPTGPTVWVLHLINRLYLGFYFRCRFNDCPVPSEGPALIVANHRVGCH